MANEILTKDRRDEISEVSAVISPTKDEISALNAIERFGFRFAHRMNQGEWKRFWTFCQKHIGSLWIYIATYNLMNVFGLENIEDAAVDRPILLVANHRSFFDLYTVSSVLFRRVKRPIQLFFPVRGKFFYDNPIGWFVNFVMGWFSMYPPFFYKNKQREFDKYSMRRLIQICSENRPNIIGLHPEGGRNLSENPYEFRRAQPGAGKIIMSARPQVIPVFIVGLGNNLPKQILGNWTGGEKVRIWFGDEIDLSEFYEKRDALRTHKEIADYLMLKIGELGEKDKNEFGNRDHS